MPAVVACRSERGHDPCAAGCALDGDGAADERAHRGRVVVRRCRAVPAYAGGDDAHDDGGQRIRCDEPAPRGPVRRPPPDERRVRRRPREAGPARSAHTATATNGPVSARRAARSHRRLERDLRRDVLDRGHASRVARIDGGDERVAKRRESAPRSRARRSRVARGSRPAGGGAGRQPPRRRRPRRAARDVERRRAARRMRRPSPRAGGARARPRRRAARPPRRRARAQRAPRAFDAIERSSRRRLRGGAAREQLAERGAAARPTSSHGASGESSSRRAQAPPRSPPRPAARTPRDRVGRPRRRVAAPSHGASSDRATAANAGCSVTSPAARNADADRRECSRARAAAPPPPARRRPSAPPRGRLPDIESRASGATSVAPPAHNPSRGCASLRHARPRHERRRRRAPPPNRAGDGASRTTRTAVRALPATPPAPQRRDRRTKRVIRIAAREGHGGGHGARAAVRTSRARPGHRAKIFALAASSSSAVRGETITNSTESAVQRQVACRAPRADERRGERTARARPAPARAASPPLPTSRSTRRSRRARARRPVARSRAPSRARRQSHARDRSTTTTRASAEPPECVTGRANAAPRSRSAAHRSAATAGRSGARRSTTRGHRPAARTAPSAETDGGGRCVVMKCSATTPSAASAATPSQSGARKLTSAPRSRRRARPDDEPATSAGSSSTRLVVDHAVVAPRARHLVAPRVERGAIAAARARRSAARAVARPRDPSRAWRRAAARVRRARRRARRAPPLRPRRARAPRGACPSRSPRQSVTSITRAGAPTNAPASDAEPAGTVASSVRAISATTPRRVRGASRATARLRRDREPDGIAARVRDRGARDRDFASPRATSSAEPCDRAPPSAA